MRTNIRLAIWGREPQYQSWRTFIRNQAFAHGYREDLDYGDLGCQRFVSRFYRRKLTDRCSAR
jgi:hypothetical protein